MRAERSGGGWRSDRLPDGPIVLSSPFDCLSLNLPLSIYSIIDPGIYRVIDPPWERGILSNIRFWPWCRRPAITSSLTDQRKCPHYGECDIDAERTGKTTGTQQLTSGAGDDGTGGDVDGSEHTPHAISVHEGCAATLSRLGSAKIGPAITRL